MNFIKKNHLLSIFLLFTVFNAQTMDQPKPTKKKKPSKLHRMRTNIRNLAGAIEDTLFGHTPSLEGAIIPQQNKEETSTLFAKLPQETQDLIFGFLTTGTHAETLKDATHSISQLARTNKKLNELINNSDFCLRTIKILSKKFKCSNALVCEALQTRAAKKRLELQQDLDVLCHNLGFNELSMAAQLVWLSRQGADFNFTYKKIGGATPLILAITANNTVAACSLIEMGADPEYATQYGTTPLKLAQAMHNDTVVTCIKEGIAKKHKALDRKSVV